MGDGRAQRVHAVRSVQGRPQTRDLPERLHARTAERAAQILPSAGVGEAAVPEQGADVLEAGPGGQGLDVMARDGEAATLAVDVAEGGPRGLDSFQAALRHRFRRLAIEVFMEVYAYREET